MRAVLRDTYAPPLLAFLKQLGAERIPHSRRTLFDHLVGTAKILESWGADDAVCAAGLFHSAYGTEFFREALLSFDDRARVLERAGERSERLAYVFCRFDRRSVYTAIARGEPYELALLRGDGTVTVTRQELADLVHVLWANALDQHRALRSTPSRDTLARSLSHIDACRPFLSEAAVEDLRSAYDPSIRQRTVTKGATMAEPGLSRLFNLTDPKTFIEGYWPDKMFVARGSVDRLAGLVDFDLRALIEMPKRYTKAFFRTIEGASSSITVTEGNEKALYDAGFTLYFHSLKGPSLDGWMEALDQELGLVRGATRVSAFASRRGLGLKPHYDMNDNFVCQAQGVKRWRIAPNTHVKYPTVGYTVGDRPTPKQVAEAPEGFPTDLPTPFETVELEPGTVMFMPRGMWHDTETVDTASLHFNVQSGLATWKDVLEFVFLGTTVLSDDEALRAPVQALFKPGREHELEEQLRTTLKTLVEQVCEGDLTIDRDALFQFIAARRGA
jgi:ribosomal protein L16 Arg81 hydroxylase